MSLIERARRHAALGDPGRLALVDDLATSDRSPGELAQRHRLPTNLVAHHLDVLESAGLIERSVSSGDRRRRYVRLRHDALPFPSIDTAMPIGPVLFVCTANSARSQLAAALWRHEIGGHALSAGTKPADHVHPGAVGAGRRFGLDLAGAVPHSLADIDVEPALVVTVCDQAHETLEPDDTWWHWSTPDPVAIDTERAFDEALNRIRRRIIILKREAP